MAAVTICNDFGTLKNKVCHCFPIYSVQLLSHVQLLCDPMDCSMPSFPVHHQLPEFTYSCPLSWWCHPTISSSDVPFSSHLQSFPASGSFQMSQFLASGGQSIGVSASASVLPMNIQDWFPLGIDWLYPPCSPSDSQESSPTPQFKSTNSSALSLLYCHIHTWLLEKP